MIEAKVGRPAPYFQIIIFSFNTASHDYSRFQLSAVSDAVEKLSRLCSCDIVNPRLIPWQLGVSYLLLSRVERSPACITFVSVGRMKVVSRLQELSVIFNNWPHRAIELTRWTRVVSGINIHLPQETRGTMLLQDRASISTAVSTLCILGLIRFVYLLYRARSRMLDLKRQGLASQFISFY